MCAWDGGARCDGGTAFLVSCGPFERAIGGTCFPDCGGGRNSPCATDEDCEEGLACSSATSEAPCMGEATCVCAYFGSPAPFFCPADADCTEGAAPHERSSGYCDCPSLTCGGNEGTPTPRGLVFPKNESPRTHGNSPRISGPFFGIQQVGETGFEPATPWSRTKCSTRLSHSPVTLAGAGTPPTGNRWLLASAAEASQTKVRQRGGRRNRHARRQQGHTHRAVPLTLGFPSL